MVSTRGCIRRMQSTAPEDQKPEMMSDSMKRKRRDHDDDPNEARNSQVNHLRTSTLSTVRINNINHARGAEMLEAVTAITNNPNIEGDNPVKEEADCSSPEKLLCIDKDRAGRYQAQSSHDGDIEITHSRTNDLKREDADDVYESLTISDDSCSEDDEMATNHYDSSQEPFPFHPVFDENFTQIKSEVLQIPQNFLSLVSEHKSGSGHIASYCKTSTSLLKIEVPKPPRIALLGNAGVGKSSLLNSLTDVNDLAKAISSGQSCTSVPSEYMSPLAEQSLKFAAKIYYLSESKITTLLKEMFGHYFEYWYQDHVLLDENMLAICQTRAQNALENLCVLFCDQEGFEDQGSAGLTLEQAWKEANDAAAEGQTATISRLLEVVKYKLTQKKFDKGSYTEFVEAETHDEFTQTIDPLIGTGYLAGRAALWPIAERVEIGVRGSRVLDHVTIVDLPGISDTNTIRCDFAVNYIKTCDHLWIVSPIKRIADDGTVSNLLSRYAKLFNNRVKIICTAIDEGIDRQLAIHLQGFGHDVKQYFEDSDTLKLKQRDFNAVNKQYKALRKRKRQTSEVMQSSFKLNARMEDLRSEILAIERKVLESLVAARNFHVTERLCENMQTYLPLHRACLSAESTGIPALRMQCLALAAPGLMHSFIDHVDNKIASFLKDVEMFTQTTNVTRRRALLDIVEKPQKALPGMIDEYCNRFTQTADSTLGAKLIAEENDIAATALQRLDQKQKDKHHATIRAFLRHDGNYSTKICSPEDWNEDFSRGMIDIVKEYGEKWKDDCNSIFGDFRACVVEGMQRMLDDLQSEASAISTPMTNFKALIDIKISAIQALSMTLQAQFERSLRSVYLDITQNTSENHFSRAMGPVYESCRRDKGDGVTLRSIKKVRAHFTKRMDDSPFVQARTEAVKDLKNCGHLHFAEVIHPKMNEVFSQLYTAFDRMINKSVENAAQKAARLKLTSIVADLQGQLRRVQEHFTDMVGHYE